MSWGADGGDAYATVRHNKAEIISESTAKGRVDDSVFGFIGKFEYFCPKYKAMAKEIERKFLVVDNSYLTLATESTDIRQAYLNVDPEATVRLRIAGEKAFITVKSRNNGASRSEWEYAIPVSDAAGMMAECATSGMIEKTRFIVPAGNGLCWEIDRFGGRLAGLVLAEIELPETDTPLPPLPCFIGREVTGDPAYYNSSLAQR